MITLSDGTTTVTLNPNLLWSDEYNWQPVEQTIDRSITGALIVQAAARVAGRPITLEPEDDNSGWMTRDTIEQLRNWAAVPGQELELTLRGEARDVLFRHQDGGIESRPVVHYADPDPTDPHLATIRLMEI